MNIKKPTRGPESLPNTFEHFGRSIWEDSESLVAVLDLAGHILDLNPAMAEGLGQPASFLKGTNFWGHLAVAGLSGQQALMQRALEKRTVQRFECRLQGRHLLGFLRPSFSERGDWLTVNIVALAGSAGGHPTTESLLCERKFRQTLENTRVGLWEFDLTSDEAWRSSEHAAIFGYEASEDGARHLGDFLRHVFPNDRPMVEQAIHEGRQAGTGWAFECRIVRKDSQIRWVFVRSAVTGLADSRRASGIIMDITERKQIEENTDDVAQNTVDVALQESESRFRTLFHCSPIAAGISRLSDGHYVDVNDAFVTMYGFTRAEVVGHTSAELGLWPEREQRAAMLKLLEANGEIRNFEAKFRTKSGVVGDSLISAAIIDIAGQPHLFGMILEYTERNALEARLRQAHRLEGIGCVVGGIAHEFNNILATFTSGLALVRNSVADAEALAALADLETMSQRAADLIKQLLAFNRQSVMKREPFEFTAEIKRQLRILEDLFGANIRVRFSAPEQEVWVHADKTLIAQVVMNLCANARDAMPTGGELEVRINKIILVAPPAKRAGGNGGGPFVQLSFTDTGHGMDEATQKRLFEPFFSTKNVVAGAGLGLASVRGIVEQHDGWVECRSELGHGSTFTVCLPATEPTPVAAVVELPTPASPVSGTILLVDDEPAVRKSYQKLFERMGYQVLVAVDGASALAVWESQRATIDLVYTDMVMPGDVSGLQLAEHVLAQKPETKVIITSGYNTEIQDLERIATTSIIYIPKPFPFDKLQQMVRECLRPH